MIIILIRFADMNTRFFQSRKNNMYVQFGKHQIICMSFRNKTKGEARLSVSKQFQTYFALLKCTFIFIGFITSVNKLIIDTRTKFDMYVLDHRDSRTARRWSYADTTRQNPSWVNIFHHSSSRLYE